MFIDSLQSLINIYLASLFHFQNPFTFSISHAIIFISPIFLVLQVGGSLCWNCRLLYPTACLISPLEYLTNISNLKYSNLNSWSLALLHPASIACIPLVFPLGKHQIHLCSCFVSKSDNHSHSFEFPSYPKWWKILLILPQNIFRLWPLVFTLPYPDHHHLSCELLKCSNLSPCFLLCPPIV